MMKINFSIVLVCVVLVNIDGFSEANAQRKVAPDARDKKVVHYAEATGELIKSGNVYKTVLELGHLEVSKKVVVTMKLKNSLDEDVKFSDVSKKCSCSAFQARDYLIPAGGEESIKLTIKTPARARSQTVTQNIVFVEDGSTVVRAALKFQLDGVLAFKEPMGFVEFQADSDFK